MDQNLNPGQESVSIELKNVSKHYGETLVLTPFLNQPPILRQFPDSFF